MLTAPYDSGLSIRVLLVALGRHRCCNRNARAVVVRNMMLAMWYGIALSYLYMVFLYHIIDIRQHRVLLLLVSFSGVLCWERILTAHRRVKGQGTRE